MPTSSRSLATPPPIFYRTKQELVYRTLRDAILTCELAPDQRDASAEELQALSGMVGEMDQAIEGGLYDTWADLNTRFHAGIAAIPGLTLLRQSSEQALDRWDRVRRFFYNGVLSHRVAQAQHEHHELMTALEAHDSAAAASTMLRHYRAALDAYLQYLDKESGTAVEAGL